MAKEASGNEFSLLHSNEIDTVYLEPFILSGYRRPGLSWWQYVKHALVLHNDVVNFWTHFIPFFIWLWWLVIIAVSMEDFFQSYNYPLLCFWLGSCFYALFSSLSHMFACKSFSAQIAFCILDYLGISMYGLGIDIGALFYCSAVSSPFLRNKTLVVWFEMAIALSTVFLCSLSRFYLRKYHFFTVAGCYAFPYFLSIVPYYHRQAQCIFHGTDCVAETFFFHILEIVFLILLTFFFVSKIPERFFPGKFDYFFHSHQLFHVCTIFFTSTQMYYAPIEMTIRRDVLSEVPGAYPDWQTTLLPFGCLLVLGLVLVCVLGYLAYIEVFTTKKQVNEKKE